MKLYSLTTEDLTKAAPTLIEPETIETQRQHEQEIHDFLEHHGKNVLLTGEKLLIIGREYQGIDLLGLDQEGALAIIELKRRESDKVIGQALRYLVTLENLDAERIETIAKEYFQKRKLPWEDLSYAFSETFPSIRLPSKLGESKRLIIVMSYPFNLTVVKIAQHLISKGEDIACIEYRFYTLKDPERKLVAFNTLVGREREEVIKKLLMQQDYKHFFQDIADKLKNKKAEYGVELEKASKDPTNQCEFGFVGAKDKKEKVYFVTHFPGDDTFRFFLSIKNAELRKKVFERTNNLLKRFFSIVEFKRDREWIALDKMRSDEVDPQEIVEERLVKCARELKPILEELGVI